MSTRSPEEGKICGNEKKNWLAFVRHQQWKEKPRMSRWMCTHGRWSSSEVERGAGETSGVNGNFFLLFAGRHVSYEMNACTEEGEEVRKKNIHNEPLVFGR